MTKQKFSFQALGGEVEVREIDVQVHSLDACASGNITEIYVRQQPKIRGKSTKSNASKNAFPALKPVEFKDISDEDFLKLAASIDENRPVLMTTHKKYAADGFRMHILENVKDDCKCVTCKNKIENISPMTPDFTQIIPRNFKGEFTLERQAFLDALNQCRVFAREGSMVVRLLIKADCVEFSAISEEFGESVTHYDKVTSFKELGFSVDFEDVVYNYNQTGNELLIAFNCQFMLDAVKCLDEVITMKYTVANAPAIFTDGNRTALLMPMHLG